MKSTIKQTPVDAMIGGVFVLLAGLSLLGFVSLGHYSAAAALGLVAAETPDWTGQLTTVTTAIMTAAIAAPLVMLTCLEIVKAMSKRR